MTIRRVQQKPVLPRGQCEDGLFVSPVDSLVSPRVLRKTMGWQSGDTFSGAGRDQLAPD
jgi:hypothetical protein